MEWEPTEGGHVLSAPQGFTSAETQSSMAGGGDGRDPPTDLTCGPWREGGPDSQCISLFWPIQTPTPGTAMILVSQLSRWKSGSSPRPAGAGTGGAGTGADKGRAGPRRLPVSALSPLP